MSEDTIYLCNFRVSTEGDWLCLQELGDYTDVNQKACKTSQNEFDLLTVEKVNLLRVCKLIIEELIDSSLKHHRMIDDRNVPLQQFCIIMEHVLMHGIKPKKSILSEKKDFWEVLELIEKQNLDAANITSSVKNISSIKTAIGRSRAWLRLALMQKRLADYFHILISEKDEILTNYYTEGAFMLGEERDVLSGLLVGLNVIDCNFSIKDEDFDQPMGLIDFGLNLKESDQHQDLTLSATGMKMAVILDQKNYLEELNRHLSATVTNLQQKLESLQTANTLMKEDLAIARNTVIEMQNQNP